MAGVLTFDFLLLPARRTLLQPDFAPSLARLLPLRRALSPFLLALHAGLANRSRHGAHPVSILSWTSVHFAATVYGRDGLHRGKQTRASSVRARSRGKLRDAHAR
jgi:hypothetical protein